MEYEEIISYLEKRSNPKNVAGMARFGITPSIPVLGVSMPELRKLAKKIGKNHALALRLWDSRIHEGRILAAFTEDVKELDAAQADRWTADFETWDLCDTVCGSLFAKMPFAYKKVRQWAKDEKEFTRRAAFALLAWLAVHDKQASNADFIRLFVLLKKYATDERKYVYKAVNWALRQVGKRNNKLRIEAIRVAKEIRDLDTKSASWIAADALRELTNPKIIGMVAKRKTNQ